MKKDFDKGILLLPLGYLLFALVLYIGFKPAKQQGYPTSAEVRAAFEEHFEEFDQASRSLWSHPDYFDSLYEKTETRGLMFNTGNVLEKYSGVGYLTEEEWNRLEALCGIIQPNEINMASHDGATAIQWVFIVKDKKTDPHLLYLYYIRVPDQSATGKEQAVSENSLSYFGRFSPLFPIEGKDFWYETTVIANKTADID